MIYPYCTVCNSKWPWRKGWRKPCLISGTWSVKFDDRFMSFNLLNIPLLNVVTNLSWREANKLVLSLFRWSFPSTRWTFNLSEKPVKFDSMLQMSGVTTVCSLETGTLNVTWPPLLVVSLWRTARWLGWSRLHGVHATQCSSDKTPGHCGNCSATPSSFLTSRWGVDVGELRTMWSLTSPARWQWHLNSLSRGWELKNNTQEAKQRQHGCSQSWQLSILSRVLKFFRLKLMTVYRYR